MKLENRTEYPRPQLVRDDWTSLDGAWDFAFDDADEGLKNHWERGFVPTHKIRVPFSYETKASGIGDPSVHEVVWYRKRIAVPAMNDRQTLLLHFEGSDYETTVWANGVLLGTHTGGYERFSFDLKKVLPTDEITLVVRVFDSLSTEQPRGKQRYRPESWGCWYVQTTGIWKSVWMERVQKTHLSRLVINADADRGTVVVTGILNERRKTYADRLIVKVYRDGETVAEGQAGADGADKSLCTLTVPNARRWRPEDPALYEVEARLMRGEETIDTVRSYFGFRTLAWKRDGLYLNGERTYLRLVLDQGYWKDSGLTPPSTDALRADLDAVVRYGYNGVRKHQKIEDERFLFLCDLYGILVFGEMAAAYAYSEEAEARFTDEWERIVVQNGQHPCIVAWVPFNESWGIPKVASDRRQQAFTERIYALTKSLDPTRPVIANDGWEHTRSDFVTIHDYRENGDELSAMHGDGDEAVLRGERSYSWYGQKLFASGYAYEGQPLLLSEYGGIAFACEDGWGYGKQVASEKDYLERFLSQNDAIRKMPQFSGFCYTQLTDVEREKNGLLTADREEKLSEQGVAALYASNTAFSHSTAR